jgi:uncharacterized protein (TIGR02598 family)
MKPAMTCRPVAASLCRGAHEERRRHSAVATTLRIRGPVRRSLGEGGFSLAEVVIALGVIAVGVIGVLGVFPTALQSGHSAQDETRAAHIAQSVFGILVAEARTASGNLNPAATIPSTTTSVNLTLSNQYTLYADNNGQLTNLAANGTYAVIIYTNNSVPGFTDPTSANLVTVRVLWPLIPGQGPTPAPNQTVRDYVRVISKY